MSRLETRTGASRVSSWADRLSGGIILVVANRANEPNPSPWQPARQVRGVDGANEPKRRQRAAGKARERTQSSSRLHNHRSNWPHGVSGGVGVNRRNEATCQNGGQALGGQTDETKPILPDRHSGSGLFDCKRDERTHHSYPAGREAGRRTHGDSVRPVLMSRQPAKAEHPLRQEKPPGTRRWRRSSHLGRACELDHCTMACDDHGSAHAVEPIRALVPIVHNMPERSRGSDGSEGRIEPGSRVVWDLASRR
jgi:hypothetical protein